ncbi:hypothetical protein [Chroogloeocystis siderophila]|nr:hypothetical protein [Chroogloeocystis siderophila]
MSAQHIGDRASYKCFMPIELIFIEVSGFLADWWLSSVTDYGRF